MGRYRFPWWRAVFGVVIGLALLLTLAPLAVQLMAVKWLERQGLQAEFGHLGFAPLRGQLSLHDIRVNNGKGEGLALAGLRLDIDWLGLLDRELRIDRIQLEGLRLDLVKSDTAGLRVAGLTLATAGPAAPEATPGGNMERPWTLRLQQLALGDIAFCYRDSGAVEQALVNLCASVGGVGLTGPLTGVLNSTPELMFDGELSVAGIHLRDIRAERSLLRLDNLSLAALNWRNDRLELARLGASDLALISRGEAEALAGDYPFHVRLRHLRLDGISRDGAAPAPLAAVEGLDAEGLTMLLHRTGKGALPLLDAVADLAVAEAAPADGDATPSALALGQMTLADGRLLLLDESAPTPVQKRLDNLTATLAAVDSRAAGRASALSLSAGLGEFGEIALSGTVKPFAEALELTLEGGMKAVDLAPFSGYMERAIGYRIVSGQLSDQFRLAIAGQRIDSVTELTLHKLDIEDLGAAAATAGAADSGLLPVGVALNLLREGDDSIVLKLPVSGDLHDPDFSLAHVAGIVARKALTEAVINYYTPFGLVSLGSMLVSSATRLRFAPLEYRPGEAAVTAAVAERLQQLAQLLAEKHSLTLVFCPRATGRDRDHLYPDDGAAAGEAQAQRLRELAAQRGLAVKRYLVDRGVAAERVVLCNPVFDPDPSAPPQVQIGL